MDVRLGGLTAVQGAARRVSDDGSFEHGLEAAMEQ